MKVNELIRLLNECDPQATVVTLVVSDDALVETINVSEEESSYFPADSELETQGNVVVLSYE
jgi:hypothetical protein